MAHDYAEDLFKSIQTIAEHCYKDQKFDETIVCVVIDDSDCKNGHYVVSNGSIKFDAYSDSQDYRNDNSVRVTILKGDYSQKKYIVGKCVSEENGGQPLTYNSPSVSVLDMTDNLANNVIDKQFALTANGDIKETCIWSIKLQDSPYKDIQNNNIYDSIVLKADFKTMFSNYNITSGSYGLYLDLYVKTSGSDSGFTRKRFWLDSSNMFGNPYNFLIFSSQEVKFNIAETDIIDGMSLYFYQNNNFTYRADNGVYKSLNNQDEMSGVSIDASDLFVSNIYVGMGTDLSNIEDNKLVIYTHNDLKYNIKDTSSSNEKEIGLIWYNKDENNKYIGFSDGIVKYNDDVKEEDKIEPYDEEEYLKKSKENTRLLTQQGQTDIPTNECGLSLGADLTELKILLPKIYNMISKDLYNELKNFRTRLSDIIQEESKKSSKPITDAFKQYFDNKDSPSNVVNRATIIKNYSEGVAANDSGQKEIKGIIPFYIDNLWYAAAAQRKKEKDPSSWDKENREPIEEDEKTYTWLNIEVLKEMSTNVEQELTNIITEIQEIFLVEILNAIKMNYSSFQGAYDSYETRINKIISDLEKNQASLTTYFKRALNIADGNKMDSFDEIFDDLQAYKSVDLSIYDNRYCIYWYYYINGYTNSEDPFGMADWKRIDDAEINKLIMNSLSSNIGLPDVLEEGTYPPKATTADSNATLYLSLPTNNKEEKFKALLFYNHEKYGSNEIIFTNERPPLEEAIKNTIIIEHSDNSQDNFPSYGVDNALINALDFNTPRKIKLRHLNEFGNFDDEKLIGMSVYWYIPINATQLRYSESDLTAFSNDINSAVKDSQFSKNGYVCFYQPITKNDEGVIQGLHFTYRIKEYFAENNTQNTIYCIVSNGETKLESSISFNFSTFGINGTDYTLKISPREDQIAVTPDNPFKFQIELFNYNNKRIVIGDKINRTTSVKLITPKGVKNLELDTFKENDEIVYGSIEWTNENSYYQILQVTINVVWDEQEGGTGKWVTLTAYRPIPYAASSKYSIQGPSTVIYDAQGGNPSYFKDSFKIFETSDTGNSEIVSSDIQWIIKYYNSKGAAFDQSSVLSAGYGIAASYMPILKQNNSLLPSNMYLQETQQSLFPIVICRRNGGTIWVQPIYLMQNRYPSAMLNTWDGSLVVDEENNRILSNLVGAGKKNNNNSFSGVLMGEIESNAGIQVDGYSSPERYLASDHTGLGLYGFHEGAQSFGFNINGTAFLGKSGGGRISFDGNHGFIYSQSWLNSFKDNEQQPFLVNNGNVKLGQGKAGMAIDLQTGHIDAFNFKLTSNKIQLNASPEDDENYFLIGSKDDDTGYLEYKATGELTINVKSLDLVTNNFKIYSKNQQEPTVVANSSELKTWRMIAGESFGVTADGDVYASAGNIAGWTIDTNKLSSSTSDQTDTYTASIQKYVSGQFNTRAAFMIEKNSEGSNPSYPFFVRYNGFLYAENAEIKGKITATSGEIGGWTIDGNILRNSDNSVYLAPAGQQYAFKAGGKFQVSSNGTLTCTGADITGVIHAQAGGSIAGWTINNSSLGKGIIGDDNSLFLSPNGRGINWDGNSWETVSIGNSEAKSDWAIAVGANFGVDIHGNLYASNAHLKSGAQVKGDVTINGWDVTENRIKYSSFIDEDENAATPPAAFTAYMQKPGLLEPGEMQVAFAVKKQPQNGPASWPFFVRYDGLLHCNRLQVGSWYIEVDAYGNIQTRLSSS